VDSPDHDKLKIVFVGAVTWGCTEQDCPAFGGVGQRIVHSRHTQPADDQLKNITRKANPSVFHHTQNGPFFTFISLSVCPQCKPQEAQHFEVAFVIELDGDRIGLLGSGVKAIRVGSVRIAVLNFDFEVVR
jgi:hypothetical protein